MSGLFPSRSCCTEAERIQSQADSALRHCFPAGTLASHGIPEQQACVEHLSLQLSLIAKVDTVLVWLLFVLAWNFSYHSNEQSKAMLVKSSNQTFQSKVQEQSFQPVLVWKVCIFIEIDCNIPDNTDKITELVVMVNAVAGKKYSFCRETNKRL